MSSKRKKSRFTRTDVNTICDMQRDISYAEQLACAIIGMTRHRDNPAYRSIPVFKNGSGGVMSDIFEAAWDAVNDKMKEFDALQAENENLKKTTF